MKVLRNAHDRLAIHFEAQCAIGDESRESVYFLDHGLTADERNFLRDEVKSNLVREPLTSFEWNTAYIPVVVCAVEVGYCYEGNGTDFWPTIEKLLGHAFNIDDRVQLSNWFAKASGRFGGVTPDDSDWERAFCHIAWPITHSVAAKDIRRPFADCLRRFEGSVDDDDLAIAGQLSSISTQVGSRRYRTWLNRQSVVAGIVRDLLGGAKLHECGLFSEGFRTRLIEDFRHEPEIQSAVRSVQSRRKKELTKKAKKTSAKAVAKDDIRFGEFFLRQDEHGDLALFGELPEMPRSVQTSLRQVRRKWQPRPWGFAGALALPSDALRSIRGTFPVELSNVARANGERAFFVGVEDLTLDDESAGWLRSVRFHAAEKLVFRPIELHGDSSHAITSPTPHSGTVWVLMKPTSTWPEVDRECVGEIDGGEIYAVDSSNAFLRDWLKWPAANKPHDASEALVQWLYPTPISINVDGRRVFTTDDEIGIHVRGDQVVDFVIRQDRSTLEQQSVNEVALVSIEQPGDYELLVQGSNKTIETFSFSIIDKKGDGFIEPDPEAPWRCVLSHVDAGVTELTRTDLFNRRLVLDIEGDRTIMGVTATVSLSPGDAATSIFLQRVPAKLGANHPVWSQLIERLPPSVVNSACDLSLNVAIANVTKDEWRLEAEIQNLWWEKQKNGIPVALCDQGTFETRHECIVTGNRIHEPKEGYPFVSIAYGSDGSEFTFDASVSVSGYAILGLQLDKPNRLLRRMEEAEGNAGLRSIVSRFLQLAAGTSSSLIAEVNRVGAVQTLREWILQSVCGSNWVEKRREGTAFENSNPVAVWWQVQQNHPDLVQPKPEMPRAFSQTLPSLVLAEFAELLPLAWWDGIVLGVSVDDAASLDSVFKHLLDGEEIYIDLEVLTASLREANEKLCGSHMADLVVPVTGGDELMNWTISGTSVASLAGSLVDWSKKFLGRGRGRQSWSVDEMRDWLNLLLYPERLRKSSWQSVIEKLLHDRPVARAGAFVAWRVEQYARMESLYEAALTAKPMPTETTFSQSEARADGSVTGTQDGETF